MADEQDIIIEDASDDLGVIDSQINVIVNAIEWPDDVYDEMQCDRVRIISCAMQIIYLSQLNILQSIELRPGTAREP